MTKRDFPKIHFYDQDFVDIYDKTWAWIADFWNNCSEKIAALSAEKRILPAEAGKAEKRISGRFFSHPGSPVVLQSDAIFASFFLVYSNRIYQAYPTIDIFYDRQEQNGAIRSVYSIETGLTVTEQRDNPENLGLPLFAWAEFNLYHKSANKKRIKEIMPKLNKYVAWIDSLYKCPNGLYAVPLSATGMLNAPWEDTVYPVDFNSMMAINALYMGSLSDILNDRDLGIHYKRQYFALKYCINQKMWDQETGFYYNLDKDEKHIPIKTIAGYWPLLAEISNEDKAEQLVKKLQDPHVFGSPHPFPSVALDEASFDKQGNGFRGSVFPYLTFMVIKGLERYNRHDLARECAIRHLYFILDSMLPEGNAHSTHHNGIPHKGRLWEAYLPLQEGAARWYERVDFPREQYLSYAALSTICLMIENIVGLSISLPRKTVDWIIPNMEVMGIENLSLKKNMITILSNRSGNRGWEIYAESEKLYYFTINILDKKKKTLPIPSGKCSMLIDKLL